MNPTLAYSILLRISLCLGRGPQLFSIRLIWASNGGYYYRSLQYSGVLLTTINFYVVLKICFHFNNFFKINWLIFNLMKSHSVPPIIMEEGLRIVKYLLNLSIFRNICFASSNPPIKCYNNHFTKQSLKYGWDPFLLRH